MTVASYRRFWALPARLPPLDWYGEPRCRFMNAKRALTLQEQTKTTATYLNCLYIIYIYINLSLFFSLSLSLSIYIYIYIYSSAGLAVFWGMQWFLRFLPRKTARSQQNGALTAEHHFLVVAPNVCNRFHLQQYWYECSLLLHHFLVTFWGETDWIVSRWCCETCPTIIPEACSWICSRSRALWVALTSCVSGYDGFFSHENFMKAAKGWIDKGESNLHSWIFFDCLIFWGCNQLKSFGGTCSPTQQFLKLWQNSRYLPCDFQRKANLGCINGSVCPGHFAMR